MRRERLSEFAGRKGDDGAVAVVARCAQRRTVGRPREIGDGQVVHVLGRPAATEGGDKTKGVKYGWVRAG